MKTRAILIVGFCLLGAGMFSVLAEKEKDLFETFTVQQIRGSECKVKTDSSTWSEAKQGTTYKAGTTGRTDAASSFTVAFDADNRFRLLGNTEVKIDTKSRVSGFRKVVDLNLAKGNVKVELESFPKDHQLKVQTPTAVCGAVGTVFEVNVDKKGGNTFSCEKGSIFANSTDYEGNSYDGFVAPSIAKGQSLKAEVAPGKDNSHIKLTAGETDLAVKVGSDKNSMTLAENSEVELAQEQSRNTGQVALKVTKGSVNGNKAGSYVVDDGEVLDYSKKEGGPGMVNDYLAAAKKEGDLRRQLEQSKNSPDEQKISSALDQAAQDATEKRKALFDFRDTIRRAVRDGMRMDRPTTIPR